LDPPDIDMSLPEDIEQLEPHTEVNNPIEQIGHIEEIVEQSLIDQDRENLETPHKQKTTGKGYNKIKKLKKEKKDIEKEG
jgi:hypothetical protein